MNLFGIRANDKRPALVPPKRQPTIYAAPGRVRHLAALIREIDAAILDMDEMLDSVGSSTNVAFASGPVGSQLGSGSADRVAAFKQARGYLLSEKSAAESELARTVEDLEAEEDIPRRERREAEVNAEVANRKETYRNAIASFMRQNDYRAAALYAREMALVRAAVEKEWQGR